MILWLEDIARATVNDVDEFTGGIWKFIFFTKTKNKKPPKSHFDASNQLGNIFVFLLNQPMFCEQQITKKVRPGLEEPDVAS